MSREGKNAPRRRRYARRRARGLCVMWGDRSVGTSQCAPCAQRSRARLDAYRGLPSWPARYKVIELTTGEERGTYDSEAAVAACLASAKLSRDEVETVSYASPMARFAAW